MLTVLNEKIYRNEDKELRLSLKGIISASNELPAPGEELEALWDRFLVRLLIEGVQDRAKFEEMICMPSTRMYAQPTSEHLITEQDYQEYSQLIDEVAVPDSVLDIIHTVRSTLAKQNKLWSDQAQGVATIYVSDRRWRKIVRLLRCSALLNYRLEVCPMDCFLMQHCLWDSPEQIETVQRIVTEAIRKHGTRVALDLGEVKSELKRLDDDNREETKGMKKQLFFKTYNLPNESENFYRLDKVNSNTPYDIKQVAYSKLKKAHKKGISCRLFSRILIIMTINTLPIM